MFDPGGSNKLGQGVVRWGETDGMRVKKGGLGHSELGSEWFKPPFTETDVAEPRLCTQAGKACLATSLPSERSGWVGQKGSRQNPLFQTDKCVVWQTLCAVENDWLSQFHSSFYITFDHRTPLFSTLKKGKLTVLCAM